MPEYLKPALIAMEAAFVLAGCVLFWRHVLRPEARVSHAASPVPVWETSALELIIFVLYVLCGALTAIFAAGFMARAFAITGDRFAVFGTAAQHLGIIAGVVVFSMSYRGRLVVTNATRTNILTSGFATFLISLPIVFLAGLIWAGLFKVIGFPLERQPAVELFLRSKPGAWLIVMVGAAGIIAPVSEELVFRAGIFRCVRTRLPRWAALLLPACLFASMHVDLATYAQLATLGVIFALAYERTGNIGTAIVAHAAFNLNMILVLLSGIAA